MMQNPLEQSSEMLMEKAVDTANLDQAWNKVRSNDGAPGPDGITISQFPDYSREHWPVIRQHLLEGTYQPGPAQVHPQTGRQSAAFRYSQRDWPSDSAGRPANPDVDLRSAFQ